MFKRGSMKLKGKIVNIISNIFYVEANNILYECTSRGIFKMTDLKPVVGDNVLLEVENGSGNIVEVVDRTKFLKRPKIANLTQLLLIVSCKNPAPDLLMLDKQLVFAEFLNIKPIIIVNKIDLEEKIADEIKDIYSKIGYTVILTNAKGKKGVQELHQLLYNQISAFSGNSGVGKSTLMNALLGENATLEGEISTKNKKGKNTTTSVKLYKVEEDSYIADTPGFSNFDINEISYKNLYEFFPEFMPFVSKCEYSDCTHIKENICGVKEQIEKKIAKSRYENYIKIYEELKEKEEHKW